MSAGREGGRKASPRYLHWLPLRSHPSQTLSDLPKSRWLSKAGQPLAGAAARDSSQPCLKGRGSGHREVNGVAGSPGQLQGIQVLTHSHTISNQSSLSSPRPELCELPRGIRWRPRI